MYGNYYNINIEQRERPLTTMGDNGFMGGHSV